MSKAPDRAPRGRNYVQFLRGLGLVAIPYSEKREGQINTIYGGRYVKRLWLHNEDLTWLTLRCIQKSNPAGFKDVIVWGVYRFLGAHFPHELPHRVIDRFARIDVLAIADRARRLAAGEKTMCKTADAIAVLLADQYFAGE